MIAHPRALDAPVLGRIATVAMVALCAGYVSLIWMTVPYLQSSGGIALWHTGFTDSLVQGSPFRYPEHIGQPNGAPIVFGASLSYLQYALMRVLGTDGVTSYSIVGSLFSVIAVSGCYLFCRNLGIPRSLSFALTVVFLSQVFFPVHIMGYGAAGFGFALLPAFCFLLQHILRTPWSGWTAASAGALLFPAVMFIAFLDGYTFVMSLACGVAILAGHALCDRCNWRKYLSVFVLLAGSTLIATTLYRMYVPDAGLPGYPRNLFAILSVHFPSLVWPTAGNSILYDLLGLSVRRVAPGTGTGLGNHETVFLSLTALATGVTTVFLRVPRTWKVIACLLIAGGLVMAVGPVVARGEAAANLLDPASANKPSFVTMPAYPFYKLPGLDQMRAVYRWTAVVKLGLWILVCLACWRLTTVGRAGVAFGLVLMIAVEGTANPLRQLSAGKRGLAMAENLRGDLVRDLGDHIPAGSKTVVLPITNDFVVHSVVAKAGIYAYNVGGDKNLLIAEWQRPQIIWDIAKGGSCLWHNLTLAVKQGELDFVAFRLFDSHRGRRGWRWPPVPEEIEENERTATKLASHLPREVVIKGAHFWFVDVRSLGPPPTQDGCAS